MESLKSYIKDNFALVAFYNIILGFSIIVILNSIIDFSSGEVHRNIIKSLFIVPFIPIAGWYVISETKELLMVLIDYKKQILVTDTCKIKNAGYEPCSEPRNGAYFTVNFHDDKHEFWLYKRSQIYSEFVIDEEYEVVYYKYSRCIHSVKRLTFNKEEDTIALNKSKRKKKSKKKVLKKPLNIEPYKTFISNYTDGFILDVFLILTIPFYVMLCKNLLPKTLPGIAEQLFTISIPIVIFFYIVIIRLAIKRIVSYICYKKMILVKLLLQ